MTANSARLFIVHLASGVIPPTRGFALKRTLFRWAGLAIGANVRIVSSVRVMTTSSVTIGSDTFIGHECLIVGGNASIDIGADVDIGPRVTFATGTHVIQPEGPHVAGKGFSLPITIGAGCWLCAGATILGGTTIGRRSIVAAGALVRGDFPDGCLIGGVPARVLRDTLRTDQV